MVRKQTWVLLGVFVILIGVAFYLQKNPLKTSAELTPSPTPPISFLPDWTTGDIIRINYQDSQGILIQLEQATNGGWMLQPDGKPVDLGKIEQIRTQILDTQVITTLDSGFDLASIGMSSPAGKITLTNLKGENVEIQIGSKTPIGTGYYVLVDQNRPMVVSSYAVETLLELLKVEALLDLTPTPELTPSLESTTAP